MNPCRGFRLIARTNTTSVPIERISPRSDGRLLMILLNRNLARFGEKMGERSSRPASPRCHIPTKGQTPTSLYSHDEKRDDHFLQSWDEFHARHTNLAPSARAAVRCPTYRLRLQQSRGTESRRSSLTARGTSDISFAQRIS